MVARRWFYYTGGYSLPRCSRILSYVKTFFITFLRGGPTVTLALPKLNRFCENNKNKKRQLAQKLPADVHIKRQLQNAKAYLHIARVGDKSYPWSYCGVTSLTSSMSPERRRRRLYSTTTTTTTTIMISKATPPQMSPITNGLPGSLEKGLYV